MHKTVMTSRPKNIISILMALTLLGSIWFVFGIPEVSVSAGPDVITNDPNFDPNSSATAPAAMTWTSVQDHPGYDIAYTNTAGNINSYTSASPYSPIEVTSYGYVTGTSGYYNGTPTPNHVVIGSNSVALYGYGVQANTDYVFTTAYHNKFTEISFDLLPSNMHFHSFHESAFLFNGVMVGGKYTGYAIALVCSNTSGAQNSGTATLSLYYLNGVTIPTGNQQFDFTPANGVTLVTSFMTGIQNLSSVPIQIKLTEDPLTKAFQIYVNGSQRINVVNPLSGTTNDGFGFLTSYYSHNCPILTVMRFDNVQPIMRPVQTSCTVNFLEDGTNTVLQSPATETGWSGQNFIVTPPEITGYVYSRSDRDLTGLTYDIDPSKNIINLYYLPFSAEKQASTLVNGIPTTNPGTAGQPVHVEVGDVINYTIPVTGQATSTFPSTPIVFNPSDLTTSQNGYTSNATNGTGGAAAFTYTNSSTGYPNGVQLAPTASPVCVQAILRQGAYNSANYYQQYLWLQTKTALPAGSYQVRITVAADARTWGNDTESMVLSPPTDVVAFMRGVAGGANSSFMTTYNKAYGYSTFTDQFFPTAASPLTLPPTATSPAGRVLFRNGITGYVTTGGNDFATTNNPYSVPAETSTFSSALVLSDAQPAIVGLCLSGRLSGNTFSSAEHYTSMIRVFKIEFLPLAPPPNPVTVTDTLPDGLTYVANSQSVAGTTSTFSQSGQTLTWNLDDLPTGTATISFQALVTQRGVFENSAQATLVATGGTITTNSTYHATDSFPVTEHYLNYNNPAQVLKPDKTTAVLTGSNYDIAYASFADITYSGRSYTYYGYRYIDPADDPATANQGAFHAGFPPSLDGSGAAATFVDIQDSKEINLYFVQNPQVTVQFYDIDNPAGAPLKSAVTDNAPYGIDYTLSGAYRNPIVQAAMTYNYYGYSTNGGATITAGSPPAPLYYTLTIDQTVKLYFKAAPAVVVHFVEYQHSLSILADDQTFLVSSAGDPFTVPVNLTNDIDLTAIGKVYTYVGYTIGAPSDSPAIIMALPPDPTIASVSSAGAEVTLYFHTNYAVTQMYHENLPYSDSSVYTPLIPDVIEYFYGGDSSSGLIHPDPLYANGYKYVYVGYKWDSDGSLLIPAPAAPAVFPIWADTTIIYDYTPQGASNNFTILTQYHKVVSGEQLLPDVIDTVIAGDSYTPPLQKAIYDANNDRWLYIGYQIDNEPLVASSAAPTLDAVNASHVITLLYKLTPNYLITEKYVDMNGNPLVPPVADTFTSIDPLDPRYTKDLPAIAGYTARGYFIGQSFNPPVDSYTPDTTVTIDPVLEDMMVYFVYSKTTDFNFYKVDENDVALQGVGFVLYSCSEAATTGHTHSWLAGSISGCWQNPLPAVSANDGLVSFTGLVSGDYMLVETTTKTGYQLPSGQWLITVNADTSDITITAHAADGSDAAHPGVNLPPAFKTVTTGGGSTGGPGERPPIGGGIGEDEVTKLLLPNYPQFSLPYAGGWGVMAYTEAGVLLIGLAPIYLLFAKKRSKDSQKRSFFHWPFSFKNL